MNVPLPTAPIRAQGWWQARALQPDQPEGFLPVSACSTGSGMYQHQDPWIRQKAVALSDEETFIKSNEGPWVIGLIQHRNGLPKAAFSPMWPEPSQDRAPHSAMFPG